MGAEMEIDMTDLAEFLPDTFRIKETTESKGTQKSEKAAAKAESAKGSQSQHAQESEEEKSEAEEAEGESEEESHEEESKEDTEAEEAEEESEEAEEESEEEQEDEEEQSGAPKKLLKRIDKLTRKRREAEEALESAREEAEQLKSQLAGAQKIILQPTPEDPLSDVESLEELESKVAAAKRVRSWAFANRDGATIKGPNGEERFLEPGEVAAHLANAEAVITDHGPKRKEWIASRQQFSTEAKAYYPQLFQAGSPAQKNLQACLKAFPDIARYPNAELIIGDALVGQQVRLAKLAAVGKAKQQSESGKGSGKSSEGVKVKSGPGKVAPTPSGGSGRSKVSATAKQASESLRDISKKGMNRDTVTSLMESIIG